MVGKKAGAGALTAEMLKNPALMQALQGKLDGIIGTPSGYIEVQLHSEIKIRISVWSIQIYNQELIAIREILAWH